MKSLEITPTNVDMCNLVCDTAIFKKMRFNEKFKVAEDTELFVRLYKNGISIKQMNSFPRNPYSVSIMEKNCVTIVFIRKIGDKNFNISWKKI
jgi:hypothetical protein